MCEFLILLFATNIFVTLNAVGTKQVNRPQTLNSIIGITGHCDAAYSAWRINGFKSIYALKCTYEL